MVMKYGAKTGGKSGNETGTRTISQMENEAKARTQAQEKEIRGLLDQIIQLYQPGGGFGKGTEAMLTRQKEKDLGSATQSLISSGLFGSTMTAGLGKKWEEEVGMPSRLKLEDMRYGALSQALGQKAGFVERIENMYPDYGLIADLQSKASSGPRIIGGDTSLPTLAGTGQTAGREPRYSDLTAQDTQAWINAYNSGTGKTGKISIGSSPNKTGAPTGNYNVPSGPTSDFYGIKLPKYK